MLLRVRVITPNSIVIVDAFIHMASMNNRYPDLYHYPIHTTSFVTSEEMLVLIHYVDNGL